MKRFIFLLAGATFFLVGCKEEIDEPEVRLPLFQTSNEQEILADEKPQTIEVELLNTDGVGVGFAKLKEEADGVHITVEAHHLSPGLHGFHIHERGVCEPPTFESAGGHFNPTDHAHGFYHPDGPHAGDLQNLEVKEDGTIKQTFINNLVTLTPDKPNSLIRKEGTSLIIHANEDDYISQPAGESGDRIVCGVIYPAEK